MNTPLKRLSLVLWLTLGAAGMAQAQEAGTWLYRIGATSITPQVDSGDLSAPALPGVKVDVRASTVLGGGVSYMLTDNWSLDLPLALPFKHSIRGAGAIAGAGEIATTKVVPTTLFAQYRFREAKASWRPYVGLGLTYANFYDETGNGTLTALTNPGGPGTQLRIEDKFALTTQAGLSYWLTPKVFVDGMVAQTYLKTRTRLSTGQTIDTTLNPITVGLYLGCRY